MDANAIDHLRALVAALDSSFISSWQSTAGWKSELDAAREYIQDVTENADGR